MRIARPSLALVALSAWSAGCHGGAGQGGAAGQGDASTSLALTDVVTGLGQTTDVAFLPDGRLVVTEKQGALKVQAADGHMVLAAQLDVDDASEKGLLGVVIDPAFASTRRLFLYYSLADAAGGTDLDRHRLVSLTLRADDTADRATEQVLVSGLRGSANHDGGGMVIGPDGKLYVGVGDSGCNNGALPSPPNDPPNHFAGCLSNANGKILRVNLDGTIPEDNPLAQVAAVTACGASCGDPLGAATAPPRREIWAWGFRNPWRFSFDPVTGALWVGDVGESSYEEIDVAQPGRHHGWPWREGAHGWPVAKCREIVPDTGDCVDPVYECRHGAAAGGTDGDCESITGGTIVDTPSWPASERGRYYFADNVNGRVWSVALDPSRRSVVAGSRRELIRLQDGIPVSLRLGPDGDLYIAVLPGRVAKLGPSSARATP
jgi:glucose/arabinose dehydrogenase